MHARLIRSSGTSHHEAQIQPISSPQEQSKDSDIVEKSQSIND